MYTIIYPSNNCTDKNEFFSMLDDYDIVEKKVGNFEELFSFLNGNENDNIYMVIKNKKMFTVQGSYKKLTGWGRYIRFNFQQEDQGKYGVETQSQSIRCLSLDEFKTNLTKLTEAM